MQLTSGMEYITSIQRPKLAAIFGTLVVLVVILVYDWPALGTQSMSVHYLGTNQSVSSNTETGTLWPSSPIAKTLTKLLEEKLSRPGSPNMILPNGCHKKETLANSCNGTCLQIDIPQDVGKRVAQIVDNPKLQMTPEQHQILRDMAKKIPGHYNVIIATAASSNHFKESQALLKNLHEKVFPFLTNFTFVYYNLGLNQKHRNRVMKGCRCHFVDFPFEQFPSFFQNRRCYTWKPVIIKAHITQANVLVWLDSSVRFDKGPDAFNTLIKRTLERGLQFGGPDKKTDAAMRTMPSMYHFFGDEPCAYLGMGEVYATFGFYAAGTFVERLFLEPWVACAINRRCMCPEPYPEIDASKSQKMLIDFKAGKGPLVYGLVHRFDQAAQGLLVQKLYRNRFRDVLIFFKRYLLIRRGDKLSDYL